MKKITEKEALQIARDNANAIIFQLKEENDEHVRKHPADAEFLKIVDYESAREKLVVNFLHVIGRQLIIVPSDGVI